MNNFIFRRQFFLTNKALAKPVSFKTVDFDFQGNKWQLNFHPDLPLIDVEDGAFRLLLLGYILNPRNPQYTDTDILHFLSTTEDIFTFEKELDKYNGRFVIICFHEGCIRLYHDAVGFRTVFFYVKDGLTALGSTPDIIASMLNIPKTNDEDILAFYNSAEYRQNDHVWVGTKTLYENIQQLCPNHYFDLSNNHTIRYWPTKQLEKINLEEGAVAIAEILKGTMTAAANRYKLHLGITAGWDTRLLLSASRHIKEKLFFYVNKSPAMSRKNKDIKIPLRLSKKLGFELNVIELSDIVDPNLRDVFYLNNCLAHEKLLSVCQEVLKRKWEHTYTVPGTMGNGLARNYMQYPKNVPFNGRSIAKFANYHNLKYPVNELDDWSDKVGQLCKDFQFEIMDLYQWEQDNSHWATLAAMEQDIVREEIIPLNNRELISLFWALDPKYRYQYYPHVYIEVINILWKELLDVPVNPSFRSSGYRILRSLGIEQKIYHFYKKHKYNSIK